MEPNLLQIGLNEEEGHNDIHRNLCRNGKVNLPLIGLDEKGDYIYPGRRFMHSPYSWYTVQYLGAREVPVICIIPYPSKEDAQYQCKFIDDIHRDLCYNGNFLKRRRGNFSRGKPLFIGHVLKNTMITKYQVLWILKAQLEDCKEHGLISPHAELEYADEEKDYFCVWVTQGLSSLRAGMELRDEVKEILNQRSLWCASFFLYALNDEGLKILNTPGFAEAQNGSGLPNATIRLHYKRRIPGIGDQ